MGNKQKIDFSSIPSTRYQGSKRKILPWIHSVLTDLEFDSVLDAFGGSGSVSYLFKKMGKSVTYNDKLKFNFFTGKALIENQFVQFTDDDKMRLLNYTHDAPGFIQDNFKNIYYLNNENKWLDKVSIGILNMNHYSGDILEYKRAIAYHSLFQASLIKRPFNLFHRKNLSLRTNNVKRTFGNKTAWDKTFIDHFESFIKETNLSVFNSDKSCIATNECVFKMQNVKYDLVYLDPPYLSKNGNNETSNYLNCYHFLEGIANYKVWINLLDHNTVNLRFNEKNQYNDFMKSTIHKTFDQLFEKFQHSTIVLSYKKGGVPSIDYLIKTMKRYKNHVYTRSLHHNYALNKQNGNTKLNREVLIIGV